VVTFERNESKSKTIKFLPNSPLLSQEKNTIGDFFAIFTIILQEEK